MKQIFLYLILTAVFIGVLGFLVKAQSTPNSPLKINPIKTVKLADTKVQVRIANTKELRTKGLGGVSRLADNEGMLFVFDKTNIVEPFWMKDMLISIDIIWIQDNKILQIDKNIPIPEPNTPDSKLKLYLPKQEIDYVLEVNANFTTKNSLKVGDPVDLSDAL